MPSFASISVTLRTLLKKIREGGRIRPPGGRGLTRHRLGYLFPYQRQSGGRGVRIPLTPYLKSLWSYRAPRGGVRKFLHEVSPEHKLTLTLGSRSGQMSNFDVSVWWSLGPAISIAFARNSAKVFSKGRWRNPVSITVIQSTGQSQDQVTKDHKRSRKVTEIKSLFSDMQHIISSHFCT